MPSAVRRVIGQRSGAKLRTYRNSGVREAEAPSGWDTERAWARIVYDVLGSSMRDGAQTAANVRALLPLYFGRIAMHVRAASGMPSSAAEALVERQAEAFEAEKPHLLKSAR